MRVFRKTAFAALLAAMSVTACQTEQTTQAGLVGVKREQRMAISAQALEDTANKQYSELMNQASQKGKLNPDPQQFARVKRIADKLIAHGIPVRMSCQSGVCGTCVTTVIDGMPDHRDHVQTPAEKAANRTITVCCSRSKTRRLVLDL